MFLGYSYIGYIGYVVCRLYRLYRTALYKQQGSSKVFQCMLTNYIQAVSLKPRLLLPVGMCFMGPTIGWVGSLQAFQFPHYWFHWMVRPQGASAEHEYLSKYSAPSSFISFVLCTYKTKVPLPCLLFHNNPVQKSSCSVITPLTVAIAPKEYNQLRRQSLGIAKVEDTEVSFKTSYVLWGTLALDFILIQLDMTLQQQGSYLGIWSYLYISPIHLLKRVLLLKEQTD